MSVQCETTAKRAVGVLVGVPVMLSVVWIVNRTKLWYEARVTQDVP